MSFTRLDDFAVLVDPLDVVVQVLSERQTGRISLDLFAHHRPVIGGVFVNHIELQGLRNKRDVPVRVNVIAVQDLVSLTTEVLGVTSTCVRAHPASQ